MAYTSNMYNSMPIPVEPAVMGVYITAATQELLIPIPWKNCKLVHAVACFDVTASAATGDIDIELNAAGGGDMFNIAVGSEQGAGTQVEGTIQTAANCINLDRDDANRDNINIEVSGTVATYTCMVYLYFETQTTVS